MTLKLKWFISGFCLLLILYVMATVWLGIMKGYPWSDMDWNENGVVGLIEVMQAKDIGMKTLEGGCREYFDYKDGERIRVVCALK